MPMQARGWRHAALPEVRRTLRELEKASVDFYATLRNAYLQTRELQIAEARPEAD